MSALYAESSAVLRWLLGTPDAGAIQAALTGASDVVCSALTSAEVRRTLQRLTSIGTIGPDTRDRALARYDQAGARWVIYAVTDAFLGRAGEAFPREPVRTLDALHLATATFHAREVAPIRMLSVDARVRENALALGLAVEPGDPQAVGT